MYNIYKGTFWLVFPHGCVICNDIFAYIVGFFFGKTPLIKLSPKKTWEGFFGGIFATMVWAVLVSIDLLSLILDI
jgi:phosphatidate cytidylyltransferase